jgi:hypothetical protein
MKRLYEIILDDGTDLLRVFIPAENEEGARTYVRGNGEIIRILDVTEDHHIDLATLRIILKEHYTKAAIDLIMRLVQEYTNCA